MSPQAAKGLVRVLWSTYTWPKIRCLGFLFQSMRPIYISLFLGLAARATTVPLGETGTNCSRFLATGLMQLELMMLFATQVFPAESVKGFPVRGSTGSVSVPEGRSE